MENNRKIIVIQANSPAGEDGQIFWLFSKNQLELVIKEIDPTSVTSADPCCEATIAWQGEILPVVRLEKHFALAETSLRSPARYLILKGAVQEEQGVRLARIAIPIFAEMKMGSLNFTGKSLAPAFLKTNADAILGSYSLTGGKVVVIPDIGRIAAAGRAALTMQEKR
jgi:chemotaxis signal transduction protein